MFRFPAANSFLSLFKALICLKTIKVFRKHLFNVTISMYIDMQFIIAVYLVKKEGKAMHKRTALILFMTRLAS